MAAGLIHACGDQARGCGADSRLRRSGPVNGVWGLRPQPPEAYFFYAFGSRTNSLARGYAFGSRTNSLARGYAFGSRTNSLARGYAFGSRTTSPARGYAFGSRTTSPARGYAFGSRTTNRAPSTFPAASRRFSALMRPRRPSMICLEMERPRPECWPKRSPRGRSE